MRNEDDVAGRAGVTW